MVIAWFRLWLQLCSTALLVHVQVYVHPLLVILLRLFVTDLLGRLFLVHWNFPPRLYQVMTRLLMGLRYFGHIRHDRLLSHGIRWRRNYCFWTEHVFLCLLLGELLL